MHGSLRRSPVIHQDSVAGMRIYMHVILAIWPTHSQVHVHADVMHWIPTASCWDSRVPRSMMATRGAMSTSCMM
jgi:hypothetical protein